MIELFKITSGYYDAETCNGLLTSWADAVHRSTRGNEKKLFLSRCNTTLRQNSFSVRVVKSWNSLPNHVISAPSVNAFRNNLEKLWSNAEILYNDFTAQTRN